MGPVHQLQRVPRALAATIFLIFCPQSADCQSAAGKDSRFVIFLQGGAAVYTDTSGSRLDAAGTPFTLRKSFATSARTSAGLRIALSSRNKLEVNYSYASGTLRHFLSTATMQGPFVDTASLYSNSIHASYVRILSRKGRWQTYLLGGMGLTAFTGRWRRETFPSGTFGAGVDLRLNKHFSLRLEQRVVITGAPQRTFFIDSPTFDVAGKTAVFVPSLGLVWRFH